ncbi:MAG: peptidylprolyl isomerase [Dehalococcoidia bacterium]
MAKRKRREQQHLRQESTRKRSFSIGGSAPNEVYKPGFPMNLFGNLKLFSIIGVGVAVLIVVGAVLTQNNSAQTAPPLPTPTATPTTDPNATPSATASVSPTVDPKRFTAAEQVVDATKNTYRATIKTNKGDIVLDLKADASPNTVNSFVFLAQKAFFDGITFHRVVKNFVIQGGDPTGTGSGGPGYQTNDEPNQVSNKRGTVSMAKSAGAPSFGSQFFINVKDNTALDFNNSQGDKFYPFAEVVSGMEIVDAISNVTVDARGKPTEAVTIQSVTVGVQPK